MADMGQSDRVNQMSAPQQNIASWSQRATPPGDSIVGDLLDMLDQHATT